MSNNYQSTPQDKDPHLWEIAQKRANFKKNLVSYLIVNGFFWAIWLFTGNQNDWVDMGNLGRHHYPWPIWPMLGWGIGVAFQYADAYIFPKAHSAESEYEKLKKQQNKQ